MSHQLTDEIIWTMWGKVLDKGDCYHRLARAAYDLAIEHVYETWNRIGEEAERDSTICWRFSRELEKMRPQEES